jgi:hypothetical protein
MRLWPGWCDVANSYEWDRAVVECFRSYFSQQGYVSSAVSLTYLSYAIDGRDDVMVHIHFQDDQVLVSYAMREEFSQTISQTIVVRCAVSIPLAHPECMDLAFTRFKLAMDRMAAMARPCKSRHLWSLPLLPAVS